MPNLADALCLNCGLCCNGVLFADVRPERADKSPLFLQHGPRVSQPCPAFNHSNCKCAVYSQRPQRCRKFECKQWIAVSEGKSPTQVALKKIQQAKKLAAKVESLLTALDFNDERLPLSKRFQRCQRAAERGELAEQTFDTLAELQLSVHKLNALLAAEFYA